MAFLPKTDYFGLTTAPANFVIISSDENRSTSTAEAQNEKGDVVATQTYGETSAPSCSYVLSGSASTSSINEMGNPISSGGLNYVITNISISTGAATPPSITVSGEEVPSGTHCSNDCYYDIPTATIDACHHAQALFGFSFASIGTGFYVTQADYTIECSLTRATENGETVAYDVTEGKVTAQFTIQGTGVDGTPSLSAPSNDWITTSPLTQSNPDAGYETYSISFTKNLAHHTSSN